MVTRNRARKHAKQRSRERTQLAALQMILRALGMAEQGQQREQRHKEQMAQREKLANRDYVRSQRRHNEMMDYRYKSLEARQKGGEESPLDDPEVMGLTHRAWSDFAKQKSEGSPYAISPQNQKHWQEFVEYATEGEGDLGRFPIGADSPLEGSVGRKVKNYLHHPKLSRELHEALKQRARGGGGGPSAPGGGPIGQAPGGMRGAAAPPLEAASEAAAVGHAFGGSVRSPGATGRDRANMQQLTEASTIIMDPRATMQQKIPAYLTAHQIAGTPIPMVIQQLMQGPGGPRPPEPRGLAGMGGQMPPTPGGMPV